MTILRYNCYTVLAAKSFSVVYTANTGRVLQGTPLLGIVYSKLVKDLCI